MVENSVRKQPLERLKRYEDNIKMKLHEIRCDTGEGTSLGSCPVAGCAISSVETRSPATRESVVYS